MKSYDDEFSQYSAARWASLVRAAVFLGCSLEEAQDLVQSTLLRCYTSWRKVEKADDRDAYVYRMLVNCLRDSRRRRWWGERPTDELPDIRVADRTDEVVTADLVHRALGELSKANREAVVLRYFAHLTEQQTASVLGVSPGAVKSRVSRALQQLAADHHLADLMEGRY